MSFIDKLLFLEQTKFFFRSRYVQMNENESRRDRCAKKIFMEDLQTREFIGYFDQPYNNRKGKFTLKDPNQTPLLFMRKENSKRGLYLIFSIDDNTDVDGLELKSPSLLGMLERKTRKRIYYYYRPGEVDLFSVRPNMIGSHFLFNNLKSSEPALIAEGFQKQLRSYLEFDLNINPWCDKYLRCVIICSMVLLARVFHQDGSS